jgi:predicted transcriptional regulator
MNLTLHLPAELEARLRQEARAAGKAPEDLAVEALEEKLSCEPSTAEIPLDQWQAEFREWIAAMPRGNPDADLGRDSIYEGRGE